jgi:hypothetical protein
MNIEDKLNRAQLFINFIDEHMNGIKLSGDIRSRVFYSLLHLSLEHFGSIVILVKNKMNGSAYALMRPQYEAVIRALYFQYCASNEEIEKFNSGKDPKGLFKMLKVLDKDLNSNSIFNFYHLLRNEMHAFTHGGLEQLSRRYSEEELISNFSEEECKKLITLSQTLAGISATCASALAGRPDISDVILEKMGIDRIKS